MTKAIASLERAALRESVLACAILAFYHPDIDRRSIWNQYYLRLCKRWHMHPETPADLEARLNAPENRFAVQEDEV